MDNKETTYETIPKNLPYKLIYEITEEEWELMVNRIKQEKMSNMDANIFMWRHLYKMHSWIFIDLAGANGFQPFAAMVGNNPSLILFTSEKIANHFIQQQNLRSRYNDLALSGFMIPSTLKFLETYQSKGISWVNFNQGTVAPFGGPISLLEKGYTWHLKNDPGFTEK